MCCTLFSSAFVFFKIENLLYCIHLNFMYAFEFIICI